MILFITARKRSLGQGNIFSSVCQEFCTHGGSASVHAGIHPLGADPSKPGIPLDQASPHLEQTPLDRAPPRSRPPWTRHPPPCTVHAGRYGQQAGGMHPTGVQYCFNINWKMNGPI